MSIEEIINQLKILHNWYCPRESKGAKAVEAAIALLKTHPEAQPNEPLTLEELREMDGEPVWVTHKDGSGGRWGIVNIYPSGICADVRSGQAYWFADYIGTIAYRRPPKEVPGND